MLVIPDQSTNLVVTSNHQTSFDSRWSQIKIVGKNIPPRSAHVAGFFSNRMFVHGGYNTESGILDDFYCIDLTPDRPEFQWEKFNNEVDGRPIRLQDHSGIVYKNMIVLFGGETATSENSNQVFCYQIWLKKWKAVKTVGITAPKLDSHSACVVENFMYVFGGYVSDKGTLFGDLLALNLETMEWKLCEPLGSNQKPEPRSGASIVGFSGCLWLFGGSDGKKTLNDMWKFDLAQFTWSRVECKNLPDPRRGHSMVLYKNKIFLFGGIQDVTREKNDVYVFEFDSKSWSKIHTYTNNIYECSPTLKKSKRQDNVVKNIDSYPAQQLSPVKSMGSGDQLMKKILNENRQKKFLEKKRQLMKKFSVNEEEAKKKRRVSPTSESMIKSLESIGDQEDNKNGLRKQIVYDETGRFIVGKKPCARDGQSVVFCGDCMYICGGDRHLMSFNDVFTFDLEKGLKSLQLYRTK